MSTMDTPDPGQKKITRIYAAMSAALVLSFVPHVLFAGLATLLFIGTLVAAYVVRAKAEEKSLAENHMTYVIRTLWITSLIAVLTVAGGVAYILSAYDPASLDRCTSLLMNNTSTDYEILNSLIQTCIGDFMADNRNAILIGSVITIGPVALYFVYRLAHGLSRAVKGYRIANPKSWF